MVQVEIFGDLDQNFYIYDFATVKAKVLEIVEQLDHYFLIATKNSGFTVEEKGEYYHISTNCFTYVLPKSNVKLLDIKATTAECLAYYIHGKLKSHFPNNKISVSLNESYGSVATYSD